MAKKKNNSPLETVGPSKKRKDTCSINFIKSTGIQDAFGDVDLDDTITITIKGKITRIHMSDSRSSFDNYESSSIEIDISSINGKNGTKESNDKEMEDMMSDKE